MGSRNSPRSSSSSPSISPWSDSAYCPADRVSNTRNSADLRCAPVLVPTVAQRRHPGLDHVVHRRGDALGIRPAPVEFHVDVESASFQISHDDDLHVHVVPVSLVRAVAGQHEPVPGSVREQQHHARLVAGCARHGRPPTPWTVLPTISSRATCRYLSPGVLVPWMIPNFAMIASAVSVSFRLSLPYTAQPKTSNPPKRRDPTLAFAFLRDGEPVSGVAQEVSCELPAEVPPGQGGFRVQAVPGLINKPICTGLLPAGGFNVPMLGKKNGVTASSALEGT